MKRVHICSFTSLDDLRAKDHGNATIVRDALLAAGRFSVFDIRTQRLAKTLDYLISSGKIHVTPLQYPWSKVEAPDAT